MAASARICSWLLSSSAILVSFSFLYGSSFTLALAAAASFQCQKNGSPGGPTLKTYTVKSSSLGSGTGIRCLEITTSFAAGTSYMVWYGEGTLGGKPYRQLGQAEYVGVSLPLAASAAHFSGNGEGITGAAVKALQVVISLDTSSVNVTGKWSEHWVLVKTTPYTPLKTLPQGCGGSPYLTSYKVKDPSGKRTGTGLRCVLNVGSPYFTWYGQGNWGIDVPRYVHLATKGGTADGGYGSADIYGLDGGSADWAFKYGDLNLNSNNNKSHITVTGKWSEDWTKL